MFVAMRDLDSCLFLSPRTTCSLHDLVFVVPACLLLSPRATCSLHFSVAPRDLFNSVALYF